MLVNAKLARSFQIGRGRRDVVARRLAQRIGQPDAGRPGVGHGLLRGEAF